MNPYARILAISVDNYLNGELSSEIRHESVAGTLFAMAGAGEAHNRISLNLAFHFARGDARNAPRGVFISEMKTPPSLHEQPRPEHDVPKGEEHQIDNPEDAQHA